MSHDEFSSAKCFVEVYHNSRNEQNTSRHCDGFLCETPRQSVRQNLSRNISSFVAHPHPCLCGLVVTIAVVVPFVEVLGE